LIGAWECKLAEDSVVRDVYKSEIIEERHRHRYEFNDAYREQLVNAGMKITGTNPETNLVEIIELSDHPWFVGVQYHPEYKSTVSNPHPLFVAFVNAAVSYAQDNSSATMA